MNQNSVATQIEDNSHLSAQDIEKIAKLAMLEVDETRAASLASSMNNILNLMAQLNAVDTQGVTPLRNPFEVAQPLREDKAIDLKQREQYQQIAPLTQDGLYLVPKVIE